jgi:ATP-dependent DNA ligase
MARNLCRVQSTNRCLAVVTGGRARLQSRQQRPLTRYFPEIVAALGEHFSDVVLDGELVVCRDGRLDFTALQRRLASPRAAAEAPASFLVFDTRPCTTGRRDPSR